MGAHGWFDINADGTLSNMQKFIDMGGMACRWMNWAMFISVMALEYQPLIHGK
jgi:hypothetical protein